MTADKNDDGRKKRYSHKTKYGNRVMYACPVCWQRTTKDENYCHPDSKAVKFDSVGEWRRWQDLVLLQKAKYITELLRQVPFKIHVNDIHVCTYYADYTYMHKDDYVVEDFKGQDTDMSKLKRKMVKAEYGIDVQLVTK